MLTIRSFRNEDPPRLLKLWRKTQQRQDKFPPLFPLSLNQLQSQILGLPMLDNRAVSIAFDHENPIGYVHTTFAPAPDGSSFDLSTGQICFLCVDPEYHNTAGAMAALIQAGERYLTDSGAKTIFGGSPSPCAPFYTAFYSGGEAIGILHSDQMAVSAFQAADYSVHKKTAWFHLDLKDHVQETPMETVGFYAELMVEIQEIPEAKTWWEGCSHANGIWFDATACLTKTHQPVARLRTRISYPDTENFLAMYSGNWFASLMELRVHPDFLDKGIQQFLLEEVVNYLGAQKQVVQAEAHVAEGSPLFSVLLHRDWLVRDSGYLFIKEL